MVGLERGTATAGFLRVYVACQRSLGKKTGPRMQFYSAKRAFCQTPTDVGPQCGPTSLYQGGALFCNFFVLWTHEEKGKRRRERRKREEKREGKREEKEKGKEKKKKKKEKGKKKKEKKEKKKRGGEKKMRKRGDEKEEGEKEGKNKKTRKKETTRIRMKYALPFPHFRVRRQRAAVDDGRTVVDQVLVDHGLHTGPVGQVEGS